MEIDTPTGCYDAGPASIRALPTGQMLTAFRLFAGIVKNIKQNARSSIIT